jgi:hypothetical protein
MNFTIGKKLFLIGIVIFLGLTPLAGNPHIAQTG